MYKLAQHTNIHPMNASRILNNTSHRPWPLPEAEWKYYQEWNKSLFMHWAVDPEILQPLIPPSTTLDLHNGKAWISIVAFTMQKIRPRNLPFFKPVSDFHEINVRTYVTKDNKPGVYFLNIEAQKILSVFLSRTLSGLPYEKAAIRRSRHNNLHVYSSSNTRKHFALHATYDVAESSSEKSALDLFLTERYCLYVPLRQQLYRYNIHHAAWPLQHVTIHKLTLQYQVGALSVNTHTPPQLSHYSEGVKVVAWSKEPA